MGFVIVQDNVFVRLGLLVQIAGAVLQDLLELIVIDASLVTLATQIVQLKRVNHFLITSMFYFISDLVCRLQIVISFQIGFWTKPRTYYKTI